MRFATAISSNRGNNNTEQDQVEYYKKAFEEGFNSWYKSYFASYLNTTEHLEELEEMMAEYAMKSAIAFDMAEELVSRLADF